MKNKSSKDSGGYSFEKFEAAIVYIQISYFIGRLNSISPQNMAYQGNSGDGNVAQGGDQSEDPFKLVKEFMVMEQETAEQSVYRPENIGKVYVSNLAKTIDDIGLYHLLSPYGNILSYNVVKDETGRSKGYGFVQFETKEAADMAVKKGTGIRDGRLLKVEHYIQCPDERESYLMNEASKSLIAHAEALMKGGIQELIKRKYN